MNYSNSNKHCSSINNILEEIVQNYGKDILQDSRKTVDLCKAIAPHATKEHHLLQVFYRSEGNRLFTAGSMSEMDRKNQMLRIMRSMIDNYWIDKGSAEEMCLSYLHAIGVTICSDTEDNSDQQAVQENPTRKKISRKILLVAVLCAISLIILTIIALNGNDDNNPEKGWHTVGESGIYTVGYPYVLIEDSVFTIDTRSISVFQNGQKRILVEDRFGNKKSICTDGQTIYAMNLSNEIISVDVQSGVSSVLFKPQGECQIVGANNSYLYLSVITEDFEYSLETDYKDIPIIQYTIDGNQIQSLGHYHEAVMCSGFLLAKSGTNSSTNIGVSLFNSNGEELFAEHYLWDATFVDGTLYYLSPIDENGKFSEEGNGAALYCFMDSKSKLIKHVLLTETTSWYSFVNQDDGSYIVSYTYDKIPCEPQYYLADTGEKCTLNTEDTSDDSSQLQTVDLATKKKVIINKRQLPNDYDQIVLVFDSYLFYLTKSMTIESTKI